MKTGFLFPESVEKNVSQLRKWFSATPVVQKFGLSEYEYETHTCFIATIKQCLLFAFNKRS